MASAKQVELFRKLTTDRQFPPGTAVETLRAQFADLSDRNASGWIERALELPRRDDSGEESVPAPF